MNGYIATSNPISVSGVNYPELFSQKLELQVQLRNGSYSIEPQTATLTVSPDAKNNGYETGRFKLGPNQQNHYYFSPRDLMVSTKLRTTQVACLGQ